MNKRILSILLCLMLVVSLLVLAVPVNAAPKSATLTLTADKTEAKPGDTVKFTVTLGPIEYLGSTEFDIAVPNGMTFVSSETTEGLATIMDVGGAQFSGKHFSLAAFANAYTSEKDQELGVITCTIDEGATGKLTLSANVSYFADYDDIDMEYTVNGADVTIGSAEPTTAPTEAPTEAPVPT